MPSTTQRRRKNRKEMLEHLKSGPCTCCGRTFPPMEMCWDQVRGLDLPSFRISMHANHSWGAVLAQIERCDLVCRECFTYRRRFRTILQSRETIVPMTDSIHEQKALEQELKRHGNN